MHIMCGTCLRQTRSERKEAKATEQGQHEAVKAAQRAPVSRAARTQDGDINLDL